MIKYTLDKEHASELFKREAVLIENIDVIPRKRAIRYLGKEAVDYANGIGEHNIYTVRGAASCDYLYKKGFEKAVTYHNIIILKEEIDEH